MTRQGESDSVNLILSYVFMKIPLCGVVNFMLVLRGQLPTLQAQLPVQLTSVVLSKLISRALKMALAKKRKVEPHPHIRANPQVKMRRVKHMSMTSPVAA